MQCHFQSGKARVVALGNREPVYIDAHIVKELADFEAVLLRTYGHHLVQRRFDLNAAADKTRSNAAGQVVALEDEHVQSLIRQHKR